LSLLVGVLAAFSHESRVPEVAHSPRDIFAMRLQRKVAGVEEANHRLRNIALKRLVGRTRICGPLPVFFF